MDGCHQLITVAHIMIISFPLVCVCAVWFKPAARISGVGSRPMLYAIGFTIL